MNKFLRKRADAPTVNDEALNALSQPPSPNLKKSATNRWKKNKRQPETKPQLDLSAALPSTDDFRTSLIMPSLSTRFSMLREQDDPKSLLGKASDDSVLQPRRKSRMADFGFGTNGLSDIAEVSSIHGSVRPPFVPSTREQSYVSDDGYGSDAEAAPSSMMGRSRPGEGNVLFGGRQKVYKIPTSGAHSTKSLGRLLYEDDVGMSAFQKYRHREREVDESQFPRPPEESQGFDFGLDQAEPGCQDEDGLETLPNDSAKDLSHSPSLSSYEKKRSTASSTARSDARSSTAATSIASQPAASGQPSPAQAPITTTTITTSNVSVPTAPMSAPLLDRSNTKTRRLYEQGLDQHMHEQQNSALSRLNSIQRQRAFSGKKSPPLLHNAKSVGNLQDRNPQPVYALRAQSPPLTSPIPALTTFGSVRHAHSNSPSPVPSGPQSPIETHFDEQKFLTQALEPADRGKATAMGAFNKPAHAFDEKQYLERQKALQRSASSAAVKKQAAPQSSVQSRINRFEFEPEQEQTSEMSPRMRSESDARQKHEPTKAYNVFQMAANAIPVDSPAEPSPASSKSPLPDTHRTFFGNISASEDEDEEEDIAQSFNQPEYGFGYHNKWQPTPLQPVSEHPALRSEKSRSTLAEENDDLEVKPLNTKASSRSLRNDLTVNPAPKIPQDLDSPTLGPQAQPLNGMVHHLRQRSNQSSLYPGDDFALPEGDVPDVPEVPWNARKTDSYGQALGSGLDNSSVRQSSYATSNPWDLDEQSFGGEPRGSRMTISPIDEGPSARFHSNRGSEISLIQDGVPMRPTLIREQSEISLVQDHDLPSWQQELRKQHTRDASTATQQERDAFADELAARRRAIQESIRSKSIVERDTYSRGTSPVPGASGAMRAFGGMLRSKTSRESFVNMQEQPQKAQKVLGVASPYGPAHSPDVGRPRGNSSPRPPMPTAQHPAFKQDGPGPSRGIDMDPQQAERSLASSRSPANSAERARSRSNSAATTGRSRSHTGPYRDDLEKAMIEGHGSTAAAHTPDVTPFPGASPDMTVYTEDSKVPMPNYFEQRALASQGSSTRLAGNGPAPVTLAPNVYTPGRPAPVANPYSQNTTPPLAGTSPQITQADFNHVMQSNARASGPGLRKKTISKSDISEPVKLLSSTSNVDTVDLPPGASLKNGMDEPPPIPPINPRRRATRKLFSRGRSESTSGENEVKSTASDPALNTSPKRDFHFPPSSVVRMPTMPAVPTLRDLEKSPAVPQYGFNPAGSPERVPPRTPAGPQRAVTAPMEGGMF